MDWQNIAAFFGIFATIVVGFYALWNRLDKKFDKIDARFDEVRKDIQLLTSRVDRLEVRVEERTFRVVYPCEEKKVL